MSIDLVRHGHVATVRINRPDKLNAPTPAVYGAPGRAFHEVNADHEVRVRVSYL
jgi:enoyl-CoA hydratase